MTTRVLGIVNLTPDSFSDGGRLIDNQSAVAFARRLIAEGADSLDIGGESTRPGATPVPAETELARVVPLFSALRSATSVPLSIDTMKPMVAKAAVEAGASIWNDVTALGFDPASPDVAAELGCEVVLMHMQGAPLTMQDSPRYADVVGEVESFLVGRAEKAVAAGVVRSRIWLDPGIGFGKSLDDNLALLAALPRLVALGYPVLLGASRKRFIAAIDPSGSEVGGRLGGSIAVALEGARAGVAAVRVHDVRETAQALAVLRSVTSAIVRT
jgi:dihydropteroate synthase